MVDRYVDRPDLMFVTGKYSLTDQMCSADFLLYYYLIYKSAHNENHPKELPRNPLEYNSICSPVSNFAFNEK